MILETICIDQYQENCYILAEHRSNEAIIIDPGGEPDKIKRALAKHNLKPAFIINTHGHIDHIGADDAFGVCVHIHKHDAAFLDEPDLNLSAFFSPPLRVKSRRCLVDDRQELSLGKIKLQVLHTPGHTPGGICLLLKEPEGNILFSGDTLFCQGIGRTDFALASPEQLKKSITEKLFALEDKTIVLPGHGLKTSIGEEKNRNSLF